MGEHDFRETIDDGEVWTFARCILADIRALEKLLVQSMIEDGARRLGVEREMYIINHDGYPLPTAKKLLAEHSDARFTTELASFEANLAPG